MPPFFEPKLRFSDAFYAIESTPKSLRKWLQNEDVVLPSSVGESAEENRGWKNFSFADLAVLALMRSLVDFGCTVIEANGLAAKMILASRSTMHPRNMPPQAFVASWLTRRIVVWRENESWAFDMPHKIGELAPPAITYLIIEPAELFRRVFARAIESNLDGEDSDSTATE